ncbi:MAG: extracellular solute-binding protein [Clostridiales bacterium]|nr:extracellular solute-binding protein [Clostridiales bacterium]
MKKTFGRLIALLISLSMLVSLSSCTRAAPGSSGNDASAISASDGSAEQTAAVPAYFSAKETEVYTATQSDSLLMVDSILLGDQVGILIDQTETVDSSEQSGQNAGVGETHKLLYFVFDPEGNMVSESDLTYLLENEAFITSIQDDGNGNMVISRVYYDTQTWSQFTELVFIGPDGKEAKPRMTNLGLFPGAEIAVDEKGNIYIANLYTERVQIWIYDPQGNLLSIIEEDNKGSRLRAIGGKIYIYSDYLSAEGETLIYPIDLEKNAYGEPISTKEIRGYEQIFSKSGLYDKDSAGIYSFDMETKKRAQMVSWSDTDLDLSRYEQVNVLPVSSEKVILVCALSNDLQREADTSASVCLVVLTKQETNPNEGKEVLILGGFYILNSPEMLAAVYRFNADNPDYRIEMRDYMNMVDPFTLDGATYMQDWFKKASELLYLDILRDDAPDIYVGRSDNASFPLERCEAQGMLADLYKLAESDATFRKEDYVENVLSLFERDGKLYQFPLSFSMEGLIGPTRLIGTEHEWTFDEFREKVEGLPEGVLFLVNTSRSHLLSKCLASSIHSFVDFEKAAVCFDTPEFGEILEFANTYGGEERVYQEPNPENDMENPEWYIDPWVLQEQGNLALNNSVIVSPLSLSRERYFFGEPVTFVGYPSIEKTGISCSAQNILAISSESKHKEAAWAFVRLCIGEEMQNMHSAPIHRGALDTQIEKLLKVPTSTMEQNYGFEEQITPEDAEVFRALVDSISALSGRDDRILAIVQEEAAAYFAGAKTKEEVAAIVQDRVTTYVNEIN